MGPLEGGTWWGPLEGVTLTGSIGVRPLRGPPTGGPLEGVLGVSLEGSPLAGVHSRVPL
jgi:hypothetical protein